MLPERSRGNIALNVGIEEYGQKSTVLTICQSRSLIGGGTGYTILNTLLIQAYQLSKLKLSAKRFYGHFHELVDHCNIAMPRISP